MKQVPIILSVAWLAAFVGCDGEHGKSRQTSSEADHQKSLLTSDVAALSPGASPSSSPSPAPIAHINPRGKGAIVVYNVNAMDASTIAHYYQERRGLAASQLCPVSLPPGIHATKDQMLGARRTIVESCICRLIPRDLRPVPCALDNIEAIAANSPITHMILIRGLPSRLTGTGWASDNEGPSLDAYLAHLVYKRESDLFGSGKAGKLDLLTGYRIDAGKTIGSKPSPVIPARDRQVVYGRVEAMNLLRTKQLIDRTLAAEGAGIRGNLLWANSVAGLPGGEPTGNFLRDLVGDLSPQCQDYLGTRQPWPINACRSAGAADGIVPAKSGTIPRAINAAMYFGTDPYPNSQAGFNGDFSRLLGWRHRNEACVELCSQMPTASEQLACRSASTDYFREINTLCVGVAPGFIGHQVRSFPVSFYGFAPQGWQLIVGSATDKTPPERRSDSTAFKNDVFSDNYYLRFGGHKSVAEPMCKLADGTTAACPERVPMFFDHEFRPRLRIADRSNGLSIKFRVRYRNPASPGASLGIQTIFRDEFGRQFIGLEGIAKSSQYVSLDRASGLTWQTIEVVSRVGTNNLPLADDSNRPGTINAPGTKAEWIDLRILSPLSSAGTDWLEIDGVEAFDVDTGARVLAVDTGSFNLPNVNNLSGGDWAANVIDRLGGIAWWGSGSHHLTAGHAFSDSQMTAGALFAGLTLGEAVYLAGKAESGTIYGDPLYSPIAVRLYLNDSTVSYLPVRSTDPLKYQALRIQESDATIDQSFRIDARFGLANPEATRWQIQSCFRGISQLDCDARGAWQINFSGTGAVSERETGITPRMLTRRAGNQTAFMRLKVWHVDDPATAYYSYAQVLNDSLVAAAQAVASIEFSGTKWAQGYSFGGTISQTTRTEAERAIANIHFLGVDKIRLNLKAGVNPATLAVRLGSVTGRYTLGSRSYSVADNALTLAISPPINEPDRLLVEVTVAGTILSKPVSILPCDLAPDGESALVVNQTDLRIFDNTESLKLINLYPPKYKIPYEVNGDGVIDSRDKDACLDLISNGLTRLPDGQPKYPAPAPSIMP